MPSTFCAGAPPFLRSATVLRRVEGGMKHFVAAPEDVVGKSRLIGIRFAMLTLRLMENWRRIFHDNDTALIALAIAVIMSERLMRTEVEPELETLAVPMPLETLAKCNISSVAAATGLNRETVRRRVNHLISMGMVVKENGAIRLAPGFTQQESVLDVVQQQFDEWRRTTTDLLRFGVVAERR